MAHVRVTLWMAACLAVVAMGCAFPPPKIEDVKDLEDGTYTISYSVTPGFAEGRRKDKAAAAASQAGDFCHAKGLKLLVTTTGRDSIVFRCISN